MILSEYPSDKLKERIGAGQERETVFLFCAGIKFLQYIAGAQASGFSLRLSRWIKVLLIYCLYSAVYLLLMNGKFSDPLMFLHWYQSLVLNFPLIECDPS